MSQDDSFPPEQIHAIIVENGKGPVLTKVEHATYFGIPCLKGIGIGVTDAAWANGRVAYVPASRIESVVIFANVDEYRKAFSRHNAAKKPSEDEGK